MPPVSPTLVFRYVFHLPEGNVEFRLELDRDTLAMKQPARSFFPEWTRLSYMKCGNCPLREEEHPRCPVAASVVEVIDVFRERVSYEEFEVEVEARGRSYTKRATLQEALSSMLGIYMVTSGCPVLNQLRPMVATHLPFMESEENTYRMVSMYLMKQMFIAREGGTADWELRGLVAFLGEARTSNGDFCRRLQSLEISDAAINAMYRLNALGEITSLTILEDDLGRWRRVFAAGQPPVTEG